LVSGAFAQSWLAKPPFDLMGRSWRERGDGLLANVVFQKNKANYEEASEDELHEFRGH
jgi:hypothetical protein